MEESGNSKDELHQFRSQWKREIEGSQQRSESGSPNESSREKLAKKLFLEGIELEKSRKYFEAIRLYRRAVQLEPNIEFKVYQSTRENEQYSKEDYTNGGLSSRNFEKSEIEESNAIDDLLESFQRQLSLENKPICESSYGAGTIRTGKHISALPVEILLLILKYVVSNDLDMRSLERFGSVCKGFYVLSRDAEIWKLACQKVWKNNVSLTDESWRDVFINRSRVLFDGCYICKISYQRLGENSFQDQFYRPVQLVEYFRLIRFFANGDVFMMTSADELQVSVNKLKNAKNAYQSREVLKGHYHYQDDHVLIVIKKSTIGSSNIMQKFRRKNSDNENYLTFFMELEIGNTSKKKFSKLMWKNYSVSQVINNQEISSDYELQSSKYPPFFFSHVKSFHIESNECLQ